MMMKLLLLVCFMLVINVDAQSCTHNCPGCLPYNQWNLAIINNGGAKCSNFSLPTPSGFTKVKNISASGTTIPRKLLSYYVMT